MTRYLSEVSGYYGCQWKQGMIRQEKNYRQMSEILQQRETDCRQNRLNSFFDNVPTKEIQHIEGYSPSAVRKQRAKTVPPLQNIYEDTIFYPSNWVSPSLTKKQRRELMNKKIAKLASKDENNNNNNIIKDNTSALRMKEKFETKFHSPQTKRRNFGKHHLEPLPEDKITRSFDENIVEEEEENESNSVVRRRNGNSPRWRPRSWSE